ncbi:MAG: sigma-54 dependent transcriptional regulator [Betaproteobacteria bacterium]|nr:sigma-54 dependent transcriptional regulator [Betaproteobacteria bacterium]
MSRSAVSIHSPTVLVVDDEADILELLEITLLRMGLDVVKAGNVSVALAKLAQRHFDLCLTDMRLPDGEGLEVVRYIQTERPTVPVAVMTAHGNTDNAVSALKAGAFDYLNKPVTLEQLRTLVASALQLNTMPVLDVKVSGIGGLIGESLPMRQTREMIAKLARTQAPVYIAGESGSGKELAARLIHAQGSRGKAPFVAVNCGAIPEALMESEFFGYRKGAFTGADSDRDGFFQAAQGGTLFLDEVAELPLTMQVKLLRVIQEKRVRRLGATQEDSIDVRIISATHQNLAQCVESGVFRQDLFYRLNVIALTMPPLRDRREDIPQIARNILQRLADVTQIAVPVLSESALSALKAYDFPGNVRELENILERVLALNGEKPIDATALQLPVTEVAAACHATNGRAQWSLSTYLDRLERAAIAEVLALAHDNQVTAAKLLGMSVRALRYRLERLGLVNE